MPVAEVAKPLSPARRHAFSVEEGKAQLVWQLGWLDGLDLQVHASLIGRASTLLLVTGHAGGDDVGPLRGTAQPSGNHMVVGVLVALDGVQAVLTLTTISGVNVFSTELDCLLAIAYPLEETHYRWHLER